MLAPQSQCVAKLTLQSVFYWQTVKITDSVYSIPVTASVWAGVQSLHLLLWPHHFNGLWALFWGSKAILVFHSTIPFHWFLIAVGEGLLVLVVPIRIWPVWLGQIYFRVLETCIINWNFSTFGPAMFHWCCCMVCTYNGMFIIRFTYKPACAVKTQATTTPVCLAKI